MADEPASAQITVKHLLTQTSGFSNSAGLLELAASDTSEQAIENSVRALKDVAVVLRKINAIVISTPGSRCSSRVCGTVCYE